MNKDAKQAITGSLGRYEAFINPYKEKEEEALKAKSEVEAAKDVMQAGREVAKATGVSALEKARAKGREEIPSVKETESLVKEAATPFVPTKETAGDMAQLFALTNILGFAMGAGGKRNAQAAMAGMNGMLEGYQKGRMDLYKKEKDIFETNMKQLKTRIDLLDRLTKQAEKTLQSNFQAGVAELDVAYAQTGADFLKQMQQKLGVARTLEHVSKLKADADKVFNIMERDRVRAEEKAAAERRHKEQMAHSEKLAKLRAEGRGAGGVSGPGGAVQFRYNQAMTNAGLQLAAAVGNLADIPMKSAPPLLAETLTNPTKSISDSVVQFLGQKITQEDSRAMQQILAGMSRAITTIEASGRPSGATEASIKEFGKVSPRAGDAKINYYLFLAESKQVMEILVKDLIAAGANKEQVDFASKARDEVSKIVTWNVKDINRILASGRERLVNDRVREQLQTSDRLNSINRMVSGMERSAATPSAETATPAATPAAAPASRKEKARPGEQVFEDAKGNKAVKRNNQWVEVE